MTLIDFFKEVDSSYIVMELLSCSLKECLDSSKGNGLTLKLTNKTAYQLILALKHLSRVKLESGSITSIIHTDLKPDNILVSHWNSDDIKIKVADFGLARLNSDEVIT